MDKNILSPEQMDSIRLFQYKPIQEIMDPSLNKANGDLERALGTMKKQNTVLQANASSLQILLDAIMLKSPEGRPEMIEDIKWNHYFYKKYNYQTHILFMIIGLCLVLILLHKFVDPSIFPAISGAVVAIAFIYIMYLLWDLYMRDDQNFDEYNFGRYTSAHPRSGVSTRSSVIDASNCVIRKESDRYQRL
jgi:hypothetical protein